MPPAAAPSGLPDLVTDSDPAAAIGTVADRLVVTLAPDGGVAVAVAVFAIAPASTSDCVTVYVAVAVTDCPGARVPEVPDGHVPSVIADRPTSGSVMRAAVSVTLPELVSRNE